uniref:Hemagglutinin glycoprotein n=1 Tax=Dolphin morbillivirus TaxID=37131 RepID=O56853_9MONO|nr:H protein [Dolphin morbillivirus]
MSSPRDKVDAFYKGIPRPRNNRVLLDNERVIIERPLILVGVLAVMFLSLVGLLAIAGVRLQKATTNSIEVNRKLSTNLETTVSIEHHVKDVLTPLLKIIGDEVGLRMPQKLTEIMQFISNKIKFLNPDREYDFNDLHWCVNPPDQVKIDYAQYCNHIAAEELIVTKFKELMNHSLDMSKGRIFPPKNCSGSVITRGQTIKPGLTLVNIYTTRNFEVSFMVTVISGGMYGKTYFLKPPEPDDPFEFQAFRIFEVGLVRDVGSREPVLQMTNFMVIDEDEGLNFCLLSVGELRLAAVCVRGRPVVTKDIGGYKDEPFKVVTLGIIGGGLSNQKTEIYPTIDSSIEKLYITSHRGIIRNSKARWSVPAIRSDDKDKMEKCTQALCKSRPPPSCNSSDWEPLTSNRIPAYAYIALEIKEDSGLELDITSNYGPLIIHGAGMDIYEGPSSNQDWLAIPPLSQSVLGVINKVDFTAGFDIKPHTLTTAVDYESGKCYVPVELSGAKDQDLKLESNLVVLPTKGFGYVTATYDTSRSEHAIVYYVYDTARSSSYFFPFRIKARGEPIYLRIECFPWSRQLWCHHYCMINSTVSNEIVVVDNPVSINMSCSR